MKPTRSVPPPYRKPSESFIKAMLRQMFGRHATCRIVTTCRLQQADESGTLFSKVFVVSVTGTEHRQHDCLMPVRVYSDYTVELC